MLINLNSSITVSPATEALAISKMGFLVHKWQSVPTYLVNEKLMDRLYPPTKRVTLAEDRLKERLREYENLEDKLFPAERSGEDWKEYHKRRKHAQSEELNRAWDSLDECKRPRTDVFVAVGLFCQDIDPELFANVARVRKKELPAGPSIFICPERVANWSLEVSEKLSIVSAKTAFDLIFQKVLFHELAHAYNTVPASIYGMHWGKIIEESLANAISYSRFEGEDRATVSAAMSGQPVEYRGYTFWTETAHGPYRSATIWRDFCDFKGELWEFARRSSMGLVFDMFPREVEIFYHFHGDFLLENQWKLCALRILRHILE